MESLKEDYVILVTPAIGVNDVGSGEKLKKILDIIVDAGIENVGDVQHGSIQSGVTVDQIKGYLKDGGRVRAVFTKINNLKKALENILTEDFGLSITLSGLIDEIFILANKLKIKPHTINLSLGIWGKTDLLPREEVLDITTMCGHHMISHLLVEKYVNEIRSNKTSYEKAVKEMAKLCVCGIFNTHRAKSLLKGLT